MERRRAAGELYVLVAQGMEGRGIVAAFTERTGGVSPDPFRSLNLAFRTGDSEPRVRRNRRRAVESLGTPAFATARQVHGVRAIRVGRRRAGAGFLDPVAGMPSADILVTRHRRVPLAVLVADCLPVVLASENLLVAVHAGWRGLAGGILDRAVSLFGDDRAVAAAVGPAIGPCHYEVDPQVADAVAQGSPGGAVRRRSRGRLFLDLPATARSVLRHAGVRSIEIAEVCTACQEDRLFSHRRDAVTGRQAGIAMRM